MTIEAMKQWREALKEYCEHGAIFMPLTALKSIDQAIADAEKQEPVALETVYETIIHWDEGGGKRSRRELARRIEALYTHPQPKREPPTTREVKDVLRATGLLTNSQAWDVAEEVMKLLAAHGIKENT